MTAVWCPFQKPQQNILLHLARMEGIKRLGLDTAHLFPSSRTASCLRLSCPLGKTLSTPVHCSSLLATLSHHRPGTSHLSSSASETSRGSSCGVYVKSNIRYRSQLSPVTKGCSPVSFSII